MHELFTKYEDFETVALVAFAVLFEVLERVRPARPLDRRRWIRLDLAALAVVVLAVNVSRLSLNAGFAALDARVALGRLADLPGAAKVAIGIVAMDFILYWIHRSMHTFDLLWRTHEWHHSTEALYWFSGFRTSFLHAFIYAVPQVLIPFFVLKLSVHQAALGFSIGVFVQLWAHANADLSLGPLDWLVISPAYHRVHHSLSKNRDLNLGTTFTIWDRMFGTFVDPRTVDAGYKLGLGYPKPAWRMMIGV